MSRYLNPRWQRRLALQRLESRQLLAVDITAVARLDVSGDGDVSEKDVTQLIHLLSLAEPNVGDTSTADVNGDGLLTPRDPLAVINSLAIQEWILLVQPETTFDRPLDPAIEKYRSFLSQAHEVLGKEIEVTYAYRTVANGLAVRMNAIDAEKIAQVESVTDVYKPSGFRPQTDAGPNWIGAPHIWDGSATGGVAGTKGEGTIIGILDSGIDFDNPSFAAVGPFDGHVHENPMGTGNHLGMCDPNHASFDASVTCNDKLIGIYDFTASTTVNDANHADHGTHVAGIAAGNAVSVPLPGTDQNVEISGVAPHANLIAYDVCKSNGLCYDDDILAAIDQAILDGVDSINFSIGDFPLGLFSALSNGFLRAREAGIFVAASAMNAGPDPSTVGVPASAPWLTAVANTWHDRLVANTLDISGPAPVPEALNDLYFVPGDNIALTEDLGPTNLLDAAAIDPSNREGCNAFPTNAFIGSVALIDRGTCFFADKVQNAEAAGAVGVIVANNVDGLPWTMAGVDVASIPSGMVSMSDGNAIADWIANNSSPTVIIHSEASVIYDTEFADIVNGSSSRGPNPFLDVITPAIAAPGSQILSALSNSGESAWGFLTGTSMASPHIAGSAALLSAIHPDWTPTEIQSAIMTSAVPYYDVLKEDTTTTADPFDVGAGRVDLNQAAIVGLVLDESIANFAATTTRSDSRQLNLPSFSHSELRGPFTWQRTIESSQETSVNWTPSFQGPAGMNVQIGSPSLNLAAGAELTFGATVDLTAPPVDPTDWMLGRLLLSPDVAGIPPAHFPVATKWDDNSLGIVIDQATTSEGDADLTAWVFRTSDTGSALSIDLSVDLPGQINLPGSVSIPAGQTTSDPFAISINDNDQTDGTRTVNVSASSAGVGSASDPIQIRDNDAPAVIDVVVNRGEGQRSIVDEVTITIAGEVEFEESTGPAIEIIHLDTSDAINFSTSVVRENGNTFVKIQFAEGLHVTTRNGQLSSLDDGFFQMKINASQVQFDELALDGNGDGMPGDDFMFGTSAADRFFRLFGDTDGDRDVDGQDFGRLRQAFLTSNTDPNYNAALDADGDGGIDGLDFGSFRRQFMKRLDF